jgi:hypothetical protein
MASKTNRQLIHALLFLCYLHVPTVIRLANEIYSSRSYGLLHSNISSTLDGVPQSFLSSGPGATEYLYQEKNRDKNFYIEVGILK